MSPSETAKSYGLKNLEQVSELSGTSVQTLINWHKKKPKLFHIVLSGCLFDARIKGIYQCKEQ